jgi:hypothetical protein
MLGIVLTAALDLLFMPVETVVVDVALYVTEIVDMTTEILTWLVDLLVAIWNHVRGGWPGLLTRLPLGPPGDIGLHLGAGRRIYSSEVGWICEILQLIGGWSLRNEIPTGCH